MNGVQSDHLFASIVNVSFVLILLFYVFFFFFLHGSSLYSYRTFLRGLQAEEVAESCGARGHIDYLFIFYGVFGRLPFLGYAFLAVWLVILFYLLGSTASQYFCSSLESFSRLLRLSPTIAGVTLLSLGNGAPDVFASVVSFTSSGVASVGISSVLGGAFFVSSAVVGVIAVSLGDRPVSIDPWSFARDIGFLAAAIAGVLAVLIAQKITLLGSIFFLVIYISYVIVVSTTHCYMEKNKAEELSAPLLPLEKEKEEEKAKFNRWLYMLELPLSLPRKLTIPVVSEEGWSKPFAICSAFFSPILLAALWNYQEQHTQSSEESLIIYLCGALVGLVLGLLVFETAEASAPPTKFLFLWLSAGFAMSVTWTYIIARELVALLFSVGCILGIRASVLGLTVLAWGNSVGDLVANVAMLVNGGDAGAKVAFAGCFAGPIFNVLVGLGLSLVFASWSKYPDPVVISGDPMLLETLGFMVGGLLWSLVMLPRREMRVDRALGFGLLAIYLCFLCVRIAESTGIV